LFYRAPYRSAANGVAAPRSWALFGQVDPFANSRRAAVADARSAEAVMRGRRGKRRGGAFEIMSKPARRARNDEGSRTNCAKIARKARE
jgi:hypothetical protein